MMYDVIDKFEDFNVAHREFDWVLNLPVYQHLHNTTSHKSLGEAP